MKRLAWFVLGVVLILEPVLTIASELILFDDAYGKRDRVHFAPSSTEIDEAAKRVLDWQATWLAQYPPIIALLIEGHTDRKEVASNRQSLALGEMRANAVKNYLVSKGIAADRISTFSYGWHRPSGVGSTAAALAKNRRAVTTLDNIRIPGSKKAP